MSSKIVNGVQKLRERFYNTQKTIKPSKELLQALTNPKKVIKIKK